MTRGYSHATMSFQNGLTYQGFNIWKWCTCTNSTYNLYSWVSKQKNHDNMAHTIGDKQQCKHAFDASYNNIKWTIKFVQNVPMWISVYFEDAKMHGRWSFGILMLWTKYTKWTRKQDLTQVKIKSATFSCRHMMLWPIYSTIIHLVSICLVSKAWSTIWFMLVKAFDITYIHQWTNIWSMYAKSTWISIVAPKLNFWNICCTL